MQMNSTVNQPISSSSSLPEDFEDTLDEPVFQTIWRDLKGIVVKSSLVLIPRSSNLSQLQNWDLWGPLLICLTLALTLGITASPGQSAIVFAGVFVVFWFGSGIVTLNGQLLGGKISFFQSLCILGYCIFPLLSCSIAFLFVRSWLIRFCILPVGLAWSTRFCCFSKWSCANK